MKRAALAAVLLAACGSGYPHPFTAEQMANVGTGDALVHYLKQPGATAAVCDRASDASHFHGKRDEDFSALVDGLVQGDIEPDLWQRCSMLMLQHMPPADASRLLEAMVRGDHRLLARSAIESDGKEQAKAKAMSGALLLRPPGTAPRREVVADDIAALRDALAKNRLGPIALRYGKELLVAIDLEAGIWKGRPLDVAALDALVGQRDEVSLQRIAVRAPDATIQKEARRRIIRLHIDASPSKYAHEHASEVEATVMETGRNAIDVGSDTPTGGWIDDEKVHVRGVLVKQDVWKQTASLFAFEGDNPSASVIPSLSLRGAFYVRMRGLAEPITVCAPPEALDVTPCILPADLHPRVPVVYIDAQGLLHFVERLASTDAVKLVYNTPNLPLEFEVNGRTVLTVEWPLVFSRPDDLVFSGSTEDRGPDLEVAIQRRYSPRILFEVKALGRTLAGVVEEADAEEYEIASRGGAGIPGHPGSPGMNGTAGSSGMPASCPYGSGGRGGDGTPGGNGTAGTAGGPGGPGGDVSVTVSCVSGNCKKLGSMVRSMVRSVGGPGGAGGLGGRGGMGGPGGMGGSGTSCSDGKGGYSYAPGGSSGSQGANGIAGANGANGYSGTAGRVDVNIAN